TSNATKKLSPSNVFKGSELANLGLPYLCFYWSLGTTTDNLNK
ncbi:8865_t:CDS:1, partial [Entrophospora sp. SA101]